MANDGNGVRADVWLWAARFFKTRARSRAAVKAGQVEVNGHACKPGKVLRPEDCLDITKGQEHFRVAVLGVSERRGPAAEAQQLYRESEASIAAREQAREQRRLAGRSAPTRRPEPRDRRSLRRLKRGED